MIDLQLNFWSLIGSVSGTLSGLSFVALSFYCSYLKHYELDAQTHFFAKPKLKYLIILMSMDFLILIHPFIISIIVLSGYRILYAIGILEILVVLFLIIQKNIFNLRFKCISKFLIIKDIVFALLVIGSLLLICIGIYNPEDTIMSINMFICISLIFIGLISVISTLDFLDHHKLMLEASVDFEDQWNDCILDLKTQYGKLEKKFEKIIESAQTKAKKDPSIKLKIHDYTHKFKNTQKEFEKLSKTKFGKYITYDEINSNARDAKKLKTDIGYLSAELKEEWKTNKKNSDK
jgi:O6-methylguanine-DNA--protein-cysteine methyltransferase